MGTVTDKFRARAKGHIYCSNASFHSKTSIFPAIEKEQRLYFYDTVKDSIFWILSGTLIVMASVMYLISRAEKGSTKLFLKHFLIFYYFQNIFSIINC